MLLIGSPSCTAFCTWQALNAARHGERDEAKLEAMRLEAEAHLFFVTEIYQMQLDAKRYFLHEHPAGATSWQLACVRKLLAEEPVERVNGDQCQYGQVDAAGNPLRKATGWMSNSNGILRMLEKKCPGRSHRSEPPIGKGGVGGMWGRQAAWHRLRPRGSGSSRLPV